MVKMAKLMFCVFILLQREQKRVGGIPSASFTRFPSSRVAGTGTESLRMGDSHGGQSQGRAMGEHGHRSRCRAGRQALPTGPQRNPGQVLFTAGSCELVLSVCLCPQTTLTDAQSSRTEGRGSSPSPGPASDLEPRLRLIQVEMPGAKRCQEVPEALPACTDNNGL